MDRRLLEYYDTELRHLREMGQEFAQEFPKLAAGLNLVDVGPCPDPYVERLLEGFAFLAARIQLKIDLEFPRFTQALLESVYPHYLAPTPSMAIVRLAPDLNESTLAEGFTVPRGTVLRSRPATISRTRCEFRTAHDVTLWPLHLEEAEYHVQDLEALQLTPGIPARAALRLRFRSTAGLPLAKLALDRLVLHLSGAGRARIRTRLYERLMGTSLPVIVRSPGPKPRNLGVVQDWRRAVGFADEEALLPFDGRSFSGYRLLKEYFALPDRFLFVEVGGLQPAVQQGNDDAFELVFPLAVPDYELERSVAVHDFSLFCTPAINLFPREADRIHLSDRHSEHRVVPDRTRPLDFEVYQVQGVTGYGLALQEAQEFRPFYAARDTPDGGQGGAFYGVHRVPRTLSEKERRLGARSTSYAGSEVYLSLVDAHAAPLHPEVRQLAVRTLCTNRDLPLHLPPPSAPDGDFTWDIGAPLESVRPLQPPTPPRHSWAEADASWRLISHLCLNYLSLTDSQDGSGAQALRDILRLYSDTGDPHYRRQVEQGVRSISTRPVVQRVRTPGPITFARGLEVTVQLEEAVFEGTGAFLMGAVLERFFARYASINSFTTTVLTTAERGEVMRWPATVGQRAVL